MTHIILKAQLTTHPSRLADLHRDAQELAAKYAEPSNDKPASYDLTLDTTSSFTIK